MNNLRNRILFPGNPWPNGHLITMFRWFAGIRPLEEDLIEGRELRFVMGMRFELQTEEYYAADNESARVEEENYEDNWKAKASWENYHRCYIGPSATSYSPGIICSDGTKKFKFDCETYSFSADPLPIDPEEFYNENVFGIYLLGHDTVADHKIFLHNRQADGSYTVDWTGKIALTYSGEEEFLHDFVAHVEGVRFDAIELAELEELEEELSDTAFDQLAINLLNNFVSDPENFKIIERDGHKMAIRI